MPDVYDHAVAYLTAHPDQVEAVWKFPAGHPAGVLFRSVSKDGVLQKYLDARGPKIEDDKRSRCGCLIQIKRGLGHGTPYAAALPDTPASGRGADPKVKDEDEPSYIDVFLTDQIRSDPYLPTTYQGITPTNLEYFGGWQRDLDTYYGRTAPEWVEPVEPEKPKRKRKPAAETTPELPCDSNTDSPESSSAKSAEESAAGSTASAQAAPSTDAIGPP